MDIFDSYKNITLNLVVSRVIIIIIMHHHAPRLYTAAYAVLCSRE